ncbi:MAG: response regulator transcription factor [Burkholderiales bacterium]|nr:response regulator transcription factor [Burkholderiales bacterium]
MKRLHKPYRVILADDHHLVRAGIRSLMADMQQFDVVAEAENGDDLIEQTVELKPDLVLVDISMPGRSGLEVLRDLRQLPEPPHVLILSMHFTPEYVLDALSAGAVGYLLKGAQFGELEIALSAAARGERYLSPGVLGTLIDTTLDRVGVSRLVSTNAVALTPRQLEILTLIASGMATKEIAYRLGLSTKTIETHRTRVMERLGIRDVAGLVLYAVRNGLIQP